MEQQGRLERFEEVDYQLMRQKQLEAVEVVAEDGAARLFLGTHPHVITKGRGGHNENILMASSVLNQLEQPELIDIERGGDVTYHGPGQLVGYPIINLKNKKDLHQYLRDLEEVIILALADFEVIGKRKQDYTGVWVGKSAERKIASIGIAVRKWVTYHGFALNVSSDLRYFHLLNPCGLDAKVMTSLVNECDQNIVLHDVEKSIVAAFQKVFAITFS